MPKRERKKVPLMGREFRLYRARVVGTVPAFLLVTTDDGTAVTERAARAEFFTGFCHDLRSRDSRSLT
jgi:hypothetical protein